MKANVKATMMETIKGLAAKCEGGVYQIPEGKKQDLIAAMKGTKFDTITKNGKNYVVYKSKMRPSGAIAEYAIVKERKASEKATKAVSEAKVRRTEKVEGPMALTIIELREICRENKVPYMKKHRALNRATLVASLIAAGILA